MLPTTPSLERLALNRLTFGARDTDVASAQSTGLKAWLDDQLNAPAGDDPALDAHLKAQRMRIRYSAGPNGAWPAADEDRPLNYISATPLTLATLASNVLNNKASPAEQIRVAQEVVAATAIRNTHAKYQLRELLVDFWHNHFNVARAESGLVQCMTPIYDRDVIRANAFGNFRALLEAVAKSASMGFFPRQRREQRPPTQRKLCPRTDGTPHRRYRRLPWRLGDDQRHWDADRRRRPRLHRPGRDRG